MAIGEPGLPKKFIWRGRTICITDVLRTWRKTGKCRNGSPEMYVRKHWYEVATESDGVMKIYFDRQARSGEGKGEMVVVQPSGVRGELQFNPILCVRLV
jgi:hypothetical protein